MNSVLENKKKGYCVDSIFHIPEGLIKRESTNLRPLAEYRSEFMRDRDRLMYSTAFRRLAGKTQIYTVGTDDHLQNRLTHTLEVAQIAKTIALALHLNVDLAEAIAIGHDFGHTPFGHAGEEMLHEIMSAGSPYVKNSPFSGKGDCKSWLDYIRQKDSVVEQWVPGLGFKHNIQSVRVVARLENCYADENKNIGLNLTNFTLFGMMRHSKMGYADVVLPPPSYQNDFKDLYTMKGYDTDAWSFEAYIVEIADDIAQWHHDLEDALREGALTMTHICELVDKALFSSAAPDKLERERLRTISQVKYPDRISIREICSIVVNTLVTDLIVQSYQNFKTLSKSVEHWRKDHPEYTGDISEKLYTDFDGMKLTDENGTELHKGKIVSFSSSINKQIFKKSIKESIHHSRNVERMNTKGRYIIRKLFEAYYANPQLLSDNSVRFLMCEICTPEKWTEMKEQGIGAVRSSFNELWKENKTTIYECCLLMRAICDHIASMTDHYAMEEFNRLYG